MIEIQNIAKEEMEELIKAAPPVQTLVGKFYKSSIALKTNNQLFYDFWNVNWF